MSNRIQPEEAKDGAEDTSSMATEPMDDPHVVTAPPPPPGALHLNALSPLSKSFVVRRKQLSDVIVMPPAVTLNEDKSFDIPSNWEFNKHWAYRNDMDELLAHNMAVQLAKSKLIESRRDLAERLERVNWGLAKAVGAVLVVARVLLNGYSATANVVELERDSDEDYNLAQHVVFIFEALAVGFQALFCLVYLFSGMATKKYQLRKLKGAKDPLTGQPFETQFRVRRRQAYYLKWSSLFLERAASFSVLKYLPSVQVVQSLVGNRHEVWHELMLKVQAFRGVFRGFHPCIVGIALFITSPLWLIFVLAYIAIKVGPYVLSPVAFVIKLRFQISFVFSTFYSDWTISQWFLLASFINSVASMINVETIRQDVVFDFVVSGSDAKYSKEEVWMRSELETHAYLELWRVFGSVKAYFIWIALDSKDLQRMTKKPGPTVHLDVLSREQAQAHGIPIPEVLPGVEEAVAKDKAERDGRQGLSAVVEKVDKLPGMRALEPADKTDPPV